MFLFSLQYICDFDRDRDYHASCVGKPDRSDPLYFCQEHIHCMGIPQFECHADPDDPFPFFTYQAPSCAKKRMAGNVTWWHFVAVL